MSDWIADADKIWARRRRYRITEHAAAQAVMSATVGTGVCLTVDGAYQLVRGAVKPSVRLDQPCHADVLLGLARESAPVGSMTR